MPWVCLLFVIVVLFDHTHLLFLVMFAAKVNRYYASPPTVYADSFENLQVFRSWSEDVHFVWI